MILFIILFLFILFLFILFSLKLQNRRKETFCVNINEKCMINQDGISNCCNGYYCIQKKGNFEYKVCSDKKPEKYKNKFNDLVIDSANKLSKAEKDIIKKYEELTEEEYFELELKDFCSSNKLFIPNIFYLDEYSLFF
jgi:hypothetical protein